MSQSQKHHYRTSNAILAIVSTLLGLLLLEYVLIPFILFRDVDRDIALMGFYAWPNTVVDDTAINGQGFTGYELLDTEKSGSEMRVLTLGGSTMFNRRMTDRMIASWSQLLPYPVRVVGGALRTHTTRASVIKYNYHFSKHQFDYVFIYHGINDLWANNVQPEHFSEDYAHQNPWGRRTALLDNFMLARMAYNHVYPGGGTFPGNGANSAGYLAERSFERNLRSLVSSIRAKKGTPVLMTFAWHIPKSYSLDAFQAGTLDYNNPTRYDYCPVELWGDVKYIETGLKRLNAIIRKVAMKLQVDLIDQQRGLASDIRNFGDPVHLSEIGTERFIDALTRYLQRQHDGHSQRKQNASSIN